MGEIAPYESGKRLCEDHPGSGIPAAGPEQVGNWRGQEEAKYNPRGEEEKEHRTVSLYRSAHFQ